MHSSEKPPVIVSPSLLSADFSRLAEELARWRRPG
jgi:pentose-5-phosphate-3-epimerase